MTIFNKKLNIFNFLPIILILGIGVLLFCPFISFDLIDFKTNNKNLHKHILGVVAYAPLALLFFSRYWREQKIHKKLLLFSLSAILIAVNYRLHDFYLFSIVLAVSAILYAIIERKFYRPTIFQILLLIYFLINAVSICWTNNYTKSMFYLELNLIFVFIPLIFCFFRLKRKDFDTVIPLFFRVMMIFAILSICSWIVESRYLKFPLLDTPVLEKQSISNFTPFDIVYSWTTYMHPTYNAVRMMLALCAGWFYVFRKDIKNNITFCELAFYDVSTFVVAILSQSRFMLVVWILANVGGLFFAVWKHKKMTIVSFAVFAALTFVFLIIFYDKIVNLATDEVRNALYNAAFQAIKENTWHGLGLGGMDDYIHNFTNIFSCDNPHNQLIGDMMQTGVLGLLSITSIIGYLLYRAIRQRDKLLLVYSLIFLVMMNIEMPLAVDKGIICFTLFFCFLLQRTEKLPQTNGSS